MPPLVFLLLAAAIHSTWTLFGRVTQKWGPVFGAALLVLVTGALLIDAAHTYQLQEACFAEKRWTVGATVWMDLAIPSAGVLLACELVERLIERTSPNR